MSEILTSPYGVFYIVFGTLAVLVGVYLVLASDRDDVTLRLGRLLHVHASRRSHDDQSGSDRLDREAL